MDTTLAQPRREGGAEPLPAARLNPPGVSEHGAYRLRFAATQSDLHAVQRLRYTVFNEELGEGLAQSALTGRDEDPFDAVCQHLLIEEAATGAVVGTYRLQCADLAGPRGGAGHPGLYSAGEFDLTGIPREALARGVELGRACVHAEHRHRRVLYLLWHGLILYCLHHGKRAFFGCSSLTSESPAEGQAFFAWLASEGYVHPTYAVAPLPEFRCDRYGATPVPTPKCPKLFGMYLRVGAKVLGPPALDREFGTIDFLTWVDLTREIAAAYGHPDAPL